MEGVSFFRRLAPFLDDPKRLFLMGDWNAILDPKIDKVGPGVTRLHVDVARSLALCQSRFLFGQSVG